VAVAEYQTPGTKAFAESILPFVHDHNTILLANHGIVCWSDTPTHAEWLVEIIDTYCKTYLIAQQVGRPVRFISDEKMREILALKRKLGFPDARLAHLPEVLETGTASNAEIDRLVEQVVAKLEGRE
jgi:L-fuculose-phosphate aldolase